MSEEGSFKGRVKVAIKSALSQLDKALDAGVQTTIVAMMNTPPEVPVDWRSMLRIGSKAVKDIGRETLAVLFQKEGEKK